MSDAIKHTTADIFFFQEDSALVHMHSVCNTVQLLRRCRLPFSWSMPLPTAPSWTHWWQHLGSHTAAWVWVVSQTDWRNQEATSWILAMHWYSIWVKNAIFVFPVLPGRPSAEAQGIWSGTAKRLLTAYFIGNISAKKYQNAFMCVKVIANQRWDVFWETLYIVLHYVNFSHDILAWVSFRTAWLLEPCSGLSCGVVLLDPLV